MKPLTCLLAALFSCPLASLATTIDFVDGPIDSPRPTGDMVGSFYAGDGFTSPNLRIHLATHPANEAFPFIDDWGAVIDSGVLGNTGYLSFTSPVDVVEVDLFASHAYTNGTDVTLTAYDSAGMFLAAVTERTAGVAPGNVSEFLPLSLSLAAPEIARVEISRTVNIGIDTLRFTPSAPQNVPDTGTTFALFGIALLGLFGASRYRRAAVA